MDEDVEQLMGQSENFGELCVEVFESRGKPRETTELFGEKFDRDLKDILSILRIGEKLDTNEILRIGIWGMGGVGKTTLAEHIHNHLLKNPQSLRVYWVSVSQDFTIKRLQGNVAKRLGLDLSHEDDEKVRARKLRDAFEKMKEMVVLMLDDVWEEFRLNSLGIDARNCRLILTTRSLQVCNQMRCHPFELKTLDTEEAWGLFERTLGSETVLDGDLEGIAKSITERCGGLPLGIVVMAGSMIGVTDIHEWRNALVDLNRVEHGKMEEKVFRILERSFNRLDKYERNCFLYCCLYPEDRKMKREELIDLFIWAELMSKRESWSEEFDEGHTILNKLIRVCLLEKTKDCVKMHDLVRDMALRITTHGNSKLESSRDDVPRFLVKSMGKGNSKVTTLEQEKWTQDLHAVSFDSDRFQNIKIEVPPAWSPNCPKLSTLLLSNVYIKEIPDSFFQHMCGLKVLNLSRCRGITELPNFVSDLVNLTALILGGCEDLRSVPPLGNLKQLRDLDLSRTMIEDLPEGWESLVNLERFNLDKCLPVSPKIIPKGTFSQFHRLQRLLLPSYGRVQVNDPEVLNQLESFKGCLSFTEFYKIIRWPKYYNNVYINDILTEGPSFLNEVRWFGGKQLHFHQCKFAFPSNNLPDDMKRLIIEDCKGMGIRCLSDVFKNFINLNHLSELYIKDLVGIEFLWQLSSASPRDQLEVSSVSPLRDLKVRLVDLPNLVGLFYGESEPYLLPAGTFSSLKELSISKCHNMKQLFTVQLLQNLQNLEELYVEDCEGLEEIAADGNGVGQGGGEGTQLTSSEGATATVILPKLRQLRLDNLPQLKNICKAAMICDSIKKIIIDDCPNLKRLPLFLPTIDGPPYLLPAGTFSSLKELLISECHNMKQLFTVQLLQSLQNLEELYVKDCEGLEEIVADGNGVGQGGGEGTQLTSSEEATATVILPKLRQLRLDNLPQLKNICKAAMICDSIKKIIIDDCPNLKRLPLFLPTIDGPPYLLPAGTFSSLKELLISECHNMKQLFTVQLLQSLQNLEKLKVEDCEGLEEIAADGNGIGQGGGEGIQFTSSEGATAIVILPKLKSLSLANLPQLKNICKATMICESIEEIKIFNCPKVKRLPLSLRTINGPPYLLPACTFSSLKELLISKCHNMKQLFTVQLLQSLQNLEVLYVKDCEGLEEIAADGNGVGQGGGEGIQLTSSEGATANVILPKLRWLHLENLSQLNNICKAAMICDSIEEIEIFNCPKVKRLPLFLSTISSQHSS
ncbi:disease resistance protein SUMM2-like [Coffea eugenioides]|uniref:disease resistance protein SUMM2-like n=1 Tax=Coffea eugenioides TaxID=49369 RepID=UPI000F604C0D|nr:disease resistance protein SUMM2-like [Coffea eugenioides]XP_027170331.1 disease resistance protein SUMM2-like [Coffea eugenioides]XP_027170332.1 disease resistance protein SUMM2-like [Coffea eugenioides]XP_027170333.1 disease resistance protein SUMM2-like [Coffea eugenioides]XP_027170335.1 disease resistance protein SUMM2-like [Coffea eugenioides]XP_027170336.1 disease resistance protein SUMM2-like [Coffea eugenioides]XP_027170337.1 disease resistance protein SUMM2-like [Coffea eugenioide